MNDKFHLTIDENIFLAKKILVSNIYNSAKLEGANTTFPETAAILSGANVPTAKLSDIQIILNLRDAWHFLLENIKTTKINLSFIKKLNEFISRNESLAWGELRTGAVGISGTNYKPAIPQEADVAENITNIVTQKSSATANAIALFQYVIYRQLFWDGNKRTATLTANALLIKHGAGILSVSDHNIVHFNQLLTQYYDTGKPKPLAQFLYDTSIIDFSANLSTTPDNVPLNVPENVPLNPTELAVLHTISQNPYATANQIAQQLGKTRKTVQRCQAELKSRGIITRIGSDKSGYWQISPLT